MSIVTSLIFKPKELKREEDGPGKKKGPPPKLTLDEEIEINEGLLSHFKFRDQEAFDLLDQSPFDKSLYPKKELPDFSLHLQATWKS